MAKYTLKLSTMVGENFEIYSSHLDKYTLNIALSIFAGSNFFRGLLPQKGDFRRPNFSKGPLVCAPSFHFLNFSINSFIFTAFSTRSSACNNFHGHPDLNSCDNASSKSGFIVFVLIFIGM